MITFKELEHANARYIDPTDEQRNVWKIADGLEDSKFLQFLNAVMETHEWSEENGYWIPKNQIGKINSGKGKAKADYKTKFYKNTAKQSKPSPMLMSLIGKTK